MDKIRASNIELLRIFAIFIIIVHHFCVHGIFDYQHLSFNKIYFINNLISVIFAFGGKIGASIFVLISGYYLIDLKFKLSHFLNIFLKTFIYSFLIYFIFSYFNIFTIPNYLKIENFLPLDFGYWFIGTYLVLYLLFPCINSFINAISENSLKYFLFILLILWYVFEFFGFKCSFSNLGCFIYLYIIGACIKKQKINILNNLKYLLIISIVSLIFIVFFCTAMLGRQDIVNLWSFSFLFDLNSIFVLVFSLTIFNIFLKLKFKQNKILNYISSSVLGIYLIHDNCIVRKFLWKDILNVADCIKSEYYIFYVLVISFCVFLICFLLDSIFSYFYGKIFLNMFNKTDKINM